MIVKPWPTSAAAAGGAVVGASTVAATANDATKAALRLLAAAFSMCASAELQSDS